MASLPVSAGHAFVRVPDLKLSSMGGLTLVVRSSKRLRHNFARVSQAIDQISFKDYEVGVRERSKFDEVC
jgi:hypothetical protein